MLLTAAATAVVCLTVRINILAMRSGGDGAAGDVVRDGGFLRTLERSVVASSKKRRPSSGILDEDEETESNNDLDAATESYDEEET